MAVKTGLSSLALKKPQKLIQKNKEEAVKVDLESPEMKKILEDADLIENPKKSPPKTIILSIRIDAEVLNNFEIFCLKYQLATKEKVKKGNIIETLLKDYMEKNSHVIKDI